MRVSIFEEFGALNSAPVFNAIKTGLSAIGIPHVSHDMTSDVALIWSILWQGRMAQNKVVWDQYRTTNRPIIIAEVGSLNRGTTWKLSMHYNGKTTFIDPVIDNRALKLKINLKPWRTNGSNILIVTQQSKSEQWNGQPDVNTWVDNVVAVLRKYTDKPIVVRPHPRQKFVSQNYVVVPPKQINGSYDSYDFINSLQNVWAVVNWSSSPGVESVLHGIPAFVGTRSLAAPVANLDLSNIENPLMPDRTQWVNKIAHTEWTLEEISTGYPLQQLFTMNNLPFQQL